MTEVRHPFLHSHIRKGASDIVATRIKGLLLTGSFTTTISFQTFRTESPVIVVVVAIRGSVVISTVETIAIMQPHAPFCIGVVAIHRLVAAVTTTISCRPFAFT